MRLQNQKDKSIKKKVKPQRKRQDSKLITESATCSSKQSKASRDWSYIIDNDSTFLPSIYKISVTENKKSDGIVKPIAIQTKLVENKNLTTTMTELRNILLSLPIPKSKGSLK